MKNNESLVWCNLPKAGLGNQLFPLLKAYVYAELHNLPIVITNYHQLKIGPYLRKEKTKRNYNNFFLFQQSFLTDILHRIKMWFLSKFKNVVEDVSDLKQIPESNTIYQFSKVAHWSDYFKDFRPHRQLIIETFYKIVRPDILAIINSMKPSAIGAHVRLGDFKKLDTEGDIYNKGAVRTPQQYFIETILKIRIKSNSELPCAVFTDGFATEVGDIIALPKTKIIEGNKDIVDLILLSKSSYIITSVGSTFSYWAGFLGDAEVIQHPLNTIKIK